jgi:hypothetical protein
MLNTLQRSLERAIDLIPNRSAQRNMHVYVSLLQQATLNCNVEDIELVWQNGDKFFDRSTWQQVQLDLVEVSAAPPPE